MIKHHFIIMFTLLSLGASAQKQFLGLERGGSAGLWHYLGDLNPQARMDRPGINAGLLVKYNFSDYISIGFQFDFGHMSYADSLNTSSYEKARNLNFSTYLGDAYIFGEFNFFRFRTGNFKYRWTPYIGTGVGICYYDPYTYYNGTEYRLQSLGTEGQFTSDYRNRRYQNFALIVPVNFGIKYWMRPGLNFAVEFTQKFSATDYIDDVSATYVGADKFIFNNRKDVGYFVQDRSIEVLPEAIGVEHRQRGTYTDYDKYLGIQFKLTYIPQKYVCPQN